MIHSLVFSGYVGSRLQMLLGILVGVALLTVDFGANESLVFMRKRRIVHMLSSRFPSLSQDFWIDESRSQALHWIATSRSKELSIWSGSENQYRILQQYSLATLYYASAKLANNTTSGNFTSWYRSDGWLEEVDECNWFGVECNKDSLNDSELSLVVGLNLSENGLTGTIPLELALLSNSLSYLYLIGNHLNGKVPSELGHMSSLQRLYLDRNKLTGSLPSEIGLATNLQHLAVAHNDLKFSLPTEIGQLSKLQTLDCHNNSLLGPLPSELGLLSTSLKTLQLSHNNIFDEIPNTLQRLKLLEWLDLSYNVLSGSLPSNLERLPNLSVVRLNHNFLKGESGSKDLRRKQRQQKIKEWDLSGNFFSDLPIGRDRPSPMAKAKTRERKTPPGTCLN
mmetsp:Transcript_2744/g.4076  ORF Transcript_2744/g.4076 Transcript_2744/m.4076 type:complete len:394 (-) Transcript_2744:776-1957(-)